MKYSRELRTHVSHVTVAQSMPTGSPALSIPVITIAMQFRRILLQDANRKRR